jgi:hypothetical protein
VKKPTDMLLSMFQWFDDFLIDKVFEPFAHWFQKLTGKDCFWLAEIIIGLYIILYGWEISLESENMLLFALRFAVFGSFLIFVYIRQTHQWREHTYRNLDKGFANPLRKIPILRILLWIVAFLTLIPFNWFTVADSITLLCWAYLISCTPLPPGQSKLKKWLEKLGSYLQPKVATS